MTNMIYTPLNLFESMKTQQQVRQSGSRTMQLIMYGLGLVLLLYLLVVGAESLTEGLILFVFYISMFIFARYLQRHGGMGWQWPA